MFESNTLKTPQWSVGKKGLPFSTYLTIQSPSMPHSTEGLSKSSNNKRLMYPNTSFTFAL